MINIDVSCLAFSNFTGLFHTLLDEFELAVEGWGNPTDVSHTFLDEFELSLEGIGMGGGGLHSRVSHLIR